MLLLLLPSDDLEKQPLLPSCIPLAAACKEPAKNKTSEFMSAAPMGGCALNLNGVIGNSVFPNVLPSTTALTTRQRMPHSTCTDCMRRWAAIQLKFEASPLDYAL